MFGLNWLLIAVGGVLAAGGLTALSAWGIDYSRNIGGPGWGAVNLCAWILALVSLVTLIVQLNPHDIREELHYSLYVIAPFASAVLPLVFRRKLVPDQDDFADFILTVSAWIHALGGCGALIAIFV